MVESSTVGNLEQVNPTPYTHMCMSLVRGRRREEGHGT